MFIIPIYLRFGLIALGILGGLALSIFNGFWYGFPFILTGIILFVGYLLFGTVQSAAKMTQNMQMEEAEQRLKLTFKPEWLYKTNRAFYYMMQGTLSMHKKDNAGAEAWLAKAQALDLPTDNEKAMVELQLANIQAMKGKWKAAQLHFRNLKKLKVTEPQLKEQVKQFEKALSNRGQLKHARMQQGRKGGFRNIR